MGQEAAVGGARVGSLPVEALAGGYMDVAPIHAAGKIGLGVGRALMDPVGRGAVKTGVQGLDRLLRDTRGSMEIPPDLPPQWRQLLEKVAGGAKEASVPAPAARAGARQLQGVSSDKALEMLAQPAKAAGLDPSKPKVFWNVDRGKMYSDDFRKLTSAVDQQLRKQFSGKELDRRRQVLDQALRPVNDAFRNGITVSNRRFYDAIQSIPGGNSVNKAFRDALMDLGITGFVKGDKKHLFDAFRKAHR